MNLEHCNLGYTTKEKTFILEISMCLLLEQGWPTSQRLRATIFYCVAAKSCNIHLGTQKMPQSLAFTLFTHTKTSVLVSGVVRSRLNLQM